MWSKILTVRSYDLRIRKKFRVYFLLSSLLFLAFVKFSDADVVIRILNKSVFDYHLISMDNGPLNSPYYNSSCISLMYTPGFNGKPDGKTTIKSMEGMLHYKNNICCVNIFLLDWSEKASTPDGIGEYATKLLYVKVVQEAIETAKRLAKLLLYWAANFNFSIACLHLIGHSLGAHLFGYTCRTINEIGDGTKVYILTGLDGAGALFGELSIYKPFDNTCATHVASIHTDETSTPETSNHYGINRTAGFDIWVNYYINNKQVQPECSEEEQPFMSEAALCSHNRAPEIYAISWLYQTCCLICLNRTIKYDQTVTLNETESQMPTFQASGAPNYYAWAAGNGSSSVIIIGACGNHNASGNYYLTTTGTYPYAKGAAGAYPP